MNRQKDSLGNRASLKNILGSITKIQDKRLAYFVGLLGLINTHLWSVCVCVCVCLCLH